MATTRVDAGLSLLMAADERPDAAGLAAAVAACQAHADVSGVHGAAGMVEVVANGLVFDCDGLAPAAPRSAGSPGDRIEWIAVRLYPGEHLSGGVSLDPVVRTLLALAAELTTHLPVQAVLWHPARSAVEPKLFAHTVLAWLAGGAFPVDSLTTLSLLADGSVVSRGLAHFIGQELILRASNVAEPLKLAGGLVDWLVRHGAPAGLQTVTIATMALDLEPARHAGQILAWPAIGAGDQERG